MRFKQAGFVITLLLFIFIFAFCSCAAQLPQVKWSIENTKALKAFWALDGKLVGILEGRKISVLDITGKTVWQKDINQPWFVVSNLTRMKILLPDGTLQVFSPLDGSKLWEKKFDGNRLFYSEGNDGTFAIVSQKSNSSELNLFSKTGEKLWQVTTKSFNPFGVLPGGKALIGISSDFNTKKTEIKIDTSQGEKTVQILNDPYLYSGESGLEVYTNSKTKQTLLVSSSTPWWAILSDSGEIIYQSNKMPVAKADLFTVCGTGFVFSSSVGNKVVAVSEKGEVLWEKEQSPDSMAGNSSYLAISTGNKVFMYDTKGNLEGSIDAKTKVGEIEIADSAPMVISVARYVGVKLFDFTK